MTLLPWLVAAWLFAVGLYGLVTSRHYVHLVGCLTVCQSATYVLLLGIGYVHEAGPPVFYDHLARHGAAVTTHLLRTVVSDGDELLRFALKQEADLIVMGAYGHARLREWLFGGVTYEMLQRSPIPCLMCH